MLKINKKTDLKEFEKYGFEYDNDSNYIFIKNDWWIIIRVYIRDISIMHNEWDTAYVEPDVLDVLFDLIKDGLVERVVE